jgi:hypothetical protein
MDKVMILFGEFSLFFENKNGTIKWRNMFFEQKKIFKKNKNYFFIAENARMLTLKSRSDFSLVVHNWIYIPG